MELFYTIFIINDCQVEYQVSMQDGSRLLLFKPVSVWDDCELPCIFYAIKKDDAWTVVNIHDANLVAQVLNSIQTAHIN